MESKSTVRNRKSLIWSTAALASVFALAGCSVWERMSGGAEPSRSAPASRSKTGVFYAAEDGVKVLAEPSASSKVVGKLARHERVTRSKLERGFAFVKSARSGSEGWVDNAKLLWRLPAAPKPAGDDAKSEPPAAEPAPPASAPAPAPPTDAPEEPPAPAAEESPPATESDGATEPAEAEPEVEPTPRGAPALFDPY